MMGKEWYSSLMEKIDDSYSDILLIHDPDKLCQLKILQQELEYRHILSYKFISEIKLRGFLSSIVKQHRIAIFIENPEGYFPSDIEQKAEIIFWDLNSVFPYLDKKTLSSFPPSLYADIYEKYKSDKHIYQILDKEQTLDKITHWLCGYNISESYTNNKLVALLGCLYKCLNQLPESAKKAVFTKINEFHLDIPYQVLESKEEFEHFVKSEYEKHKQPGSNSTESNLDFDNPFLLNIRKELCLETGSINTKRLEVIYTTINDLLNSDKINWVEIGKLWGEYSFIKDELLNENGFEKIYNIINEYESLDTQLESLFSKHILSNYKSQFYRNTESNLVTIDRVLQHISSTKPQKVLLFCFDGMAFQEWNCIKSFLVSKKGADFKFHERGIYALVPTITSISRLALFSGEKNPKIKKEDNNFISYISDNLDVAHHNIRLFKNINMKWNDYYLDYPFVGMVSNIVDDTAHEISINEKNKRLMQSILLEKLKYTDIEELFDQYLKEGYQIFITSDHGTIWGYGNDYRVEKYLIESRSKRALSYSDRKLAESYYENKKDELYWYENEQIMGEDIALFPKGRYMFIKNDKLAISHGGIHLEEVVIPFIEVTK